MRFNQILRPIGAFIALTALANAPALPEGVVMAETYPGDVRHTAAERQTPRAHGPHSYQSSADRGGTWRMPSPDVATVLCIDDDGGKGAKANDVSTVFIRLRGNDEDDDNRHLCAMPASAAASNDTPKKRRRRKLSLKLRRLLRELASAFAKLGMRTWQVQQCVVLLGVFPTLEGMAWMIGRREKGFLKALCKEVGGLSGQTTSWRPKAMATRVSRLKTRLILFRAIAMTVGADASEDFSEAAIFDCYKKIQSGLLSLPDELRSREEFKREMAFVLRRVKQCVVDEMCATRSILTPHGDLQQAVQKSAKLLSVTTKAVLAMLEHALYEEGKGKTGPAANSCHPNGGNPITDGQAQPKGAADDRTFHHNGGSGGGAG